MCPHWAQRRRWNHQPPVSSHSAQPVPLGGADGSIPGIAAADIAHHHHKERSGMEPGIYGTDGTDPEEASGVLEPEDTLEGTRGVRDVLDTGWSPAERPWAVNDWGTTEAEESAGESLDGRLARELPDGVEDEGDGFGDTSDTDGELLDDEVGDERAGRLVDSDDGGTGDDDDELWARDEGIDGAAASAEEAAMHVIRDRE
jgi:hypothetical protein